MAFKTIAGPGSASGGRVFVNANKMTVGDKVEGYFLGYRLNQYQKEVLTFQADDGNIITLTTVGNLIYLSKDNKLTTGAYTRVTLAGSRPSKRNATESVKQFKIEQDTDKTISMEDSTKALETAAAEPTPTPQERLARAKAKAQQQAS